MSVFHDPFDGAAPFDSAALAPAFAIAFVLGGPLADEPGVGRDPCNCDKASL